MEELKEGDLGSRPTVFRCSFAGCHRTFNRACHLANHEKCHKGPMKKPRSVLEMSSVRSMMSAAQLLVQVESGIRLLLYQ